MKRDDIIATLQMHRTELEKRGVLHAALFGSVARGEEGTESDIDIMIDIEQAKWTSMSIYDYAGIKRYVAAFFGSPVDVVNLQGLKPHVQSSALADAIYAF